MTNTRRKIASAKHNTFVAEGVPEHRPTYLAPKTLLAGPSDETRTIVDERRKAIEKRLSSKLGKPYYSGYGFILYNGDCCEILDRIKETDVRLDLTVTSPPYNIGKEYEAIKEVPDFVSWCTSWMKTIHQVTVDNGAFWLNLGYFEVESLGLCVPIPYLLWDKSPFYMMQEVVWHYGAGVATKKRFSPRNEKWLYYVKDEQSYVFNLDAVRDPNVKYPNQKKNGKFRCNPLGKNPSDVWEFPKVTTGKNRSSKERTGHPAQFPLEVIDRIVKVSSNHGGVVLDPFSGSASTGISAVGNGRVYIGIEILEDYCALSCERYERYMTALSEEQRQSSLF
jgi:adenine-specific DNA-methyltransferase